MSSGFKLKTFAGIIKSIENDKKIKQAGILLVYQVNATKRLNIQFGAGYAYKGFSRALNDGEFNPKFEVNLGYFV